MKRDTFMTPQEFARLGARLYGNNWQSRLARAWGKSRTTMFRYATGCEPIPRDRALMLQLMAARLDAGLTIPELQPVGAIEDGKFLPP